ncbi:MAG: cytochrome c oxidase subunit II [Acidimicrobiia bacterium]|jgi:cytochrome c oxidase subunit 2
MTLTRRKVRRAALVLGALAATACSGPGSLLEPRGPGARNVENLWWLLFWVSVVVLVAVLVLLAYSLRGRADSRSDDEWEPPGPTPAWGRPFVIFSGFVVPAVILITVLGISLVALAALDDLGPSRVRVEVTGHMWWWEARYPGGAVTANEIHIPVGEPVEFELTSADVIHSFWIPTLHPKRDMIPGRTNRVTMQADEPGRYWGQCAEFCGLQHAGMAVSLVADPDFDQWLLNQQEPAVEPSDANAERGREVFMESTCIGCHTIRGTRADSEVGPDLTHLADRAELAAGALDNTRANLARLITDPQSVKPGVVMPPTSLDEADLQALLDYLGSLR